MNKLQKHEEQFCPKFKHTEMRHQHELKKTRMLIDAMDYFIQTFKDSPFEKYKIGDYKELLKELVEEEARIERTIERN